MRAFHRQWLGFLTLVTAASAAAEPIPAQARAEVLAVLAKLESSGCQFNRNGSWFAGKEARAHLERKLEYLEKNASAKSAEAFIDLAATKSSVSGTAYQVRCGTEPPAQSAAWLTEQLKQIRLAASAGKPK